MIIVVDSLGTSFGQPPTDQTQYFCLNSGAEISRQRSFIHPARMFKPSSPRVFHTSSSRTHPSHPFWIQLCGLNCGTTPSARDDGRIDTLWVASAAEWRPSSRTCKDPLKHTTIGAKIPGRHYITAVTRDRRDLDQRNAGYRSFRV
jgi:hypothetical protein